MKSEPLRRDEITNQLREQISELRSDQLVRLSPERELAVTLGVSRIVLRNAIKTLIDEGLLIQKQGSGTYILPETTLEALHIFKAPDIREDDPFHTAFLAELSRWANKESLYLHFIDESKLHERRSDIPIVIIGVLENGLLEKVKQGYKNVIAINILPGKTNITQVTIDDYEIGYDAALKIIECGHRNLLLISGPDRYPAPKNRKHGFLDAVEHQEVTIHEYNNKMNYNGGYQAGTHFIEEFSENGRPTAVFTVNDWMAIGMMHKLLEAGIQVPKDVSVIGCDDIPLASQISPGLSTFRWDLPLLLREIVAIAKEMYTTEAFVVKKVLLTAPYIERGSLRRI